LNANENQSHQITNLSGQVDDLERTLEDRKVQNETLTNELSKLETEKDAVIAVNQEQCDRIVQLSEELKSTATTLSDVQKLISADQEQATQMQHKIQSLETEQKVLEESILSVKRDRDDVASKLEFSKQEAEDLSSKLQSLTMNFEQLTVDRDSSESKLKICRQEASDLLNRLQSSEFLTKSMANKCDQLANDRDIVQRKLEISWQEVDDISSELKHSECLAKSLTNTCDKLKSCIAELDTKHVAAEALMNDLRSENQRNIAKCRRLEETSQSEMFCLENIITSLKKEYEAFKLESRAAAAAAIAAQLRSCEVKLESLCAINENCKLEQQSKTFDDMIVIIKKDRSNLLERVKLSAKKLEAAQNERSCLEDIVTSLKNEYEAFKVESAAAIVAQMKSCESKLEPLCTTGSHGALHQQDRSFDDMIAIVQNERSNLFLLAKEFEAAQDENVILGEQVRILSTEVSKYKLQNKGMLQALDEITNINWDGRGDGIHMGETAVNREVQTRLISFRHKVELQSNASVVSS